MDSSIIILSQEQRKELTTIPENISDYVMAKYYTLSEEDIYHIQTHRRDTNKLGFAIQLCCIKYPGWGFTSTKAIPEKVLNYVSKQLGISPINIHSYGERKNTRTKHIELHFRSRITLRMDIGYFFQLQRTIKGGGVVVPTTEIKEVAGIGVYLRQVLDFVSKSQHIFYI